MNTQSKKNYSILFLLAGTLMVGFSMGRWMFPLAAWIGPALMLRYNRNHKGWRSFLLLLVAYMLAFSIGFMPIWIGGHWPLPLLIGLPILYGLLWSLPYQADRFVRTRLAGFLGTLAYPLTATTIEFINNHTNPVGSWGMTGYTQYGNLLVMQLASITGMIGITFLMGWFVSTFNWAWENRSKGKEIARGLAIYSLVFAAVFVFGFLRLNQVPSGETVRVAGLTSYKLSTAQVTGEEEINLPVIWDTFFKETEREAQAGAHVIFWHESVGTGTEAEVASLISQAQEVARQHGIYLGIPLLVTHPGTDQPGENKLVVIDPKGAIVLEHVKYGGNIFEGTLLGDGNLQTVNTPFGVLSGAICYDMDYPDVIKQAGQKGIGLMLVPSGDWLEIDPIHSEMAVFRAIENGMSIVRQVYGGLSIATDPYGRVLAQTDFYSSTDRILVAQVPAKHVTTLYSLFGYWFEWVCLLGFLALTGRAVFTKRPAQV